MIPACERLEFVNFRLEIQKWIKDNRKNLNNISINYYEDPDDKDSVSISFGDQPSMEFDSVMGLYNNSTTVFIHAEHIEEFAKFLEFLRTLGFSSQKDINEYMSYKTKEERYSKEFLKFSEKSIESWIEGIKYIDFSVKDGSDVKTKIYNVEGDLLVIRDFYGNDLIKFMMYDKGFKAETATLLDSRVYLFIAEMITKLDEEYFKYMGERIGVKPIDKLDKK